MNGINSKSETGNRLASLRESLENIRLPISDFHKLSENAVKISILLTEFIDPLSDLENEYQLTRSSCYNALLRTGVKPTPAKDAMELSPEVIEKRVYLSKWQNYVKSKENIVIRIERFIDTKVRLESRQI